MTDKLQVTSGSQPLKVFTTSIALARKLLWKYETVFRSSQSWLWRFLGHDVVSYGESIPTFRGNVTPSSSSVKGLFWDMFTPDPYVHFKRRKTPVCTVSYLRKPKCKVDEVGLSPRPTLYSPKIILITPESKHAGAVRLQLYLGIILKTVSNIPFFKDYDMLN